MTVADFKHLRKPLDELDARLTLRSYILGHSFTAADVVVWGALRGNKVVVAEVKKVNNNVSRWFHFIEASNPWMTETVATLQSHSRKEQAAASSAGAVSTSTWELLGQTLLPDSRPNRLDIYILDMSRPHC